MSKYIYTAWWPYSGWVIGYEVEAWTLGQEKHSCSTDQCYNYISRNRSCEEFSIEFSCINPIQGSSSKLTLKFLSCNTSGLGTMLKIFWWTNCSISSAQVVFHWALSGQDTAFTYVSESGLMFATFADSLPTALVTLTISSVPPSTMLDVVVYDFQEDSPCL